MRKIEKITLILFFLPCISLYSQSAWNISVVNPDYDLTFLSYKDTSKIYTAGNPSFWAPRIFRSTNSGSFWNELIVSGYHLVEMYFLNVNTGFILRTGHNELAVERTVDGGNGWSLLFSQVNSTGYDFIHFVDVNTGYMWGALGIKKTTDGGSWAASGFGIVNSVTKMLFINSNTGFINGVNSSTSSNCIARTTDQGTSWVCSDITNQCRMFDFVDNNTGYAICSNSVVLKTTNSGLNWTSINILPAADLISLSFPDLNTGYLLASTSKVYKTIDGGSNWVIQILPSSSVTVRTIEFATSTKGIISCSGGTIFKTTTGGEMLGIKQYGNSIPSKFSLHQNYPNPFNPSTNIGFDLPEASSVKLLVYDIYGRLIRVLVNEKLSPGSYYYELDNTELASGVYFYSINAGKFSSTKKMIILK